MFEWLFRLLGSMLSFFESFTGAGGYALALVLYALVAKIVFLPFSIKQQKNQIAMAKLAPKIELIKAKYKGRNDQPTMQKQQQEIMELQQQEGYNPLSGCLPLLIQLPVIMLLYTVINNPLTYIAMPTNAVSDYNDAIKNELVLDSIDENLMKHYADKIEKKEEIEMDDILLAIYRDVWDDAYNKRISEIEASTDMDEAKKANEIEKIKSEMKDKASRVEKADESRDIGEIEIINVIYTFIGDNETYASSETLKNESGRIAYINSFGLDYDSIPNFILFGVNLADTPKLTNLSILCIIPVLAAIGQWFTMWLTRKLNGNNQLQAADAQTQASMKMMDFMFPGLTLFMAFKFSGMLGLYWTIQSFLGLLQSVILAKVMPLPKFSEEEIKEFKKAQKETEKTHREVAKAQPKHRSLHYIDDEDYDVLPDVPKNESGAKDKRFDGDIPQIKD